MCAVYDNFPTTINNTFTRLLILYANFHHSLYKSLIRFFFFLQGTFSLIIEAWHEVDNDTLLFDGKSSVFIGRGSSGAIAVTRPIVHRQRVIKVIIMSSSLVEFGNGVKLKHIRSLKF